MILVKENIWVSTPPLGEGVIIYVSIQSPHSNDIFTVGLKSGEIRHFDTTQLTLSKNHTLGINLEDKKP